MATRTPSFKLGVLNMTICFQSSRPPRHFDYRSYSQPRKSHQTPSFAPRYKDNGLTPSGSARPRQDGVSPYLSYRRSHRQSLRHFREQGEEQRKFSRIVGFSPQVNKAIQIAFPLETKGDAPATQPVARTARECYARKVLNKKLLQKDAQDRPRKSEGLSFYLDSNPEEPLRSPFTIRPARTSTRACRNSPVRYERGLSRTPVTRNEGRRETREAGERKLRPWSPTRSPFSRRVMLESALLQSSYPQSPKNDL